RRGTLSCDRFRSLTMTPKPSLPIFLCALSLSFAGCTEPSITSPDARPPPDRDQAPADGGPAFFQGTVEDVVLRSEVNQTDKWREWKRDPSYLTVSDRQHLFFAGSPGSSNTTERWTLVHLDVPATQLLSAATRDQFSQVYNGRPGLWDSSDLTSPAPLY